MADTGHRVRLLSICVGVWSIATVLAGTVTSYIQMVLTRIVVGIGEAGGNPVSVSLIGDYYEPETRTRGLSFFNLGASMGAFFGLAAVGAIADQLGWRVAFYAMGLPGILLAILILITLKEPKRGRFQDDSVSYETDINWWQAITDVLSRWTVRHGLIGFAIVSFGGSGVGAWFGAFFMRAHDLSLTEVGAVIGLVLGISGFAGTLLGAVFTPMLVRRDRRWEMWLPGLVYAIVLPLYMYVFYSENLTTVFIVLGIVAFIGGTAGAPILSAIQSVLPAHLRAMGMALIMFAANFIGAGAGPVLVGWASDALAPIYGTDSLRYALMIGVAFVGWGLAHFFLASKHIKRELIS